MSQARMLLKVAILVLLIVSSAEIWVKCMCDDDVIVIEGELTAKSEIPTLKDISPYREALVVFEYRVRKRIKGKFSGKKIRITHWAIYDEQPQVVIKRKIGSKKKMELRSLHQLRELESIYMSDTLDIEPDLPFYHDIGQNIRLNQSVKNRYDYRCSLSDTMPAFWMLKDQLKLVAIGDSRGYEGIRAELLYGEKNSVTPIAYNLSVTSAPIELQEILVREYLLKVPELEWVVYQMSPRVLGTSFNISKHGNLTRSPGYDYDRKHADSLWKNTNKEAVTVNQIAITPYVAKCW